MAKQSMGEFLTVLRKGQGFTQDEIAEKLGVSCKTISSWENGRTYPDIMMLPVIAELFGITVDELVKGERISREDANASRLSDKSLLKLRKLKYVKYKDKRFVFTLCAFFCGLLSVLGLYLMTFAATWTLVFASVGFAGIIVFGVLIFINKRSFLRSEGLILAEDITEEMHPMVLSAGMDSLYSLLFTFLPYLVYGLVFIVIYWINPDAFIYRPFESETSSSALGINLSNDVIIDSTKSVMIPAVISFAVGLIMAIAFLVLRLISIFKYGGNGQKEKEKFNIKAGVITALCIPALLGLITGGAFLISLIVGRIDLTYEVSYLSETLSEYEDKLATYTVKNYFLEGSGLTPGDEYRLSLPAYTDKYTPVYDCGNGFMLLSSFSLELNPVEIYLKDEEGEDYIYEAEISEMLYNNYFGYETKENISVTYYDLTVNCPDEMFEKIYDADNGLYYLNFKEGEYFTDNNIRINVVEYDSRYYTTAVKCDGLYYRKSAEDMLGDWEKDYLTEIDYLIVQTGNPEDVTKKIPVIAGNEDFMYDDTSYDILGYTVNTVNTWGYIEYEPHKGEFGSLRIACYYVSDIALALLPYVFLAETAAGLITLTVIFKKQKYGFEFIAP